MAASPALLPAAAGGEGLQSRLQVAFGIDQEVGADHDLLVLGDALQDLGIAVGPAADFDLARLVAAFATLHQHRLALAGIENGALGNGQGSGARHVGVELDRGEHVGLELAVRVVELDADLGRAGCHGQGRIDEGDLAVEALAWEGVELDLGFLADLHQRQVLLVDLGDHPDVAEVHQPVERIAGGDARAFDRHLLDHLAAFRRDDWNGGRRVLQLDRAPRSGCRRGRAS